MKYIRTKDGISATDYHNDEMGYFITLDYVDYKDTEVIKQADTIEELCDYIIYYNFEDRVVIRELPVNIRSIINDVKFGLIKEDVKLAILTDKGLIYVAKMNEKGELELL